MNFGASNINFIENSIMSPLQTTNFWYNVYRPEFPFFFYEIFHGSEKKKHALINNQLIVPKIKKFLSFNIISYEHYRVRPIVIDLTPGQKTKPITQNSTLDTSTVLQWPWKDRLGGC